MVGLRGDQIGTMRMLTDANGATVRRTVMTAFGEPMYDSQTEPGASATGTTRYQYAGAWGYETGLVAGESGGAGVPPVFSSFLHVGERWYDPSTGRFLQRDPIGIRGGLNTYHAVRNSPVLKTDPTGLINDWNVGILPPSWEGASSPWGAPKPPPKPGEPHGPPGPPYPPPEPLTPPSPRDIQKVSQWTAGGCALIVGFSNPVTGLIIGATLIVEDILDYTGVLPAAPGSWNQW